MSFYKFDPDDIFINTLEGYPEFSFYIVSGTVYIDSMPHKNQTNPDVPDGFVSIYEINNDKPVAQRINPKAIKSDYFSPIKSITQRDYRIRFNYTGEDITGSYNLSASIARDYYETDSLRPRVNAIRNALEHYGFVSPQYQWTSSFGDKSTQEMSVISIPSIFYGERIKKGSVILNYYISGTLIGTLNDYGYNGELIQTGPVGSTGSGSCAGVVLYKEGVMLLTGSWSLGAGLITYSGSNAVGDKWTMFGDGLHKEISGYATLPSASFSIDYQGVSRTNTMTMLAHARYGELNYSNNPTFKKNSGRAIPLESNNKFAFEEFPVLPKNITDTPLTDVTPNYKKETYITKVAIYDKDKNLIGYAKTAKPVRKTEDRQYTFKLKLDL